MYESRIANEQTDRLVEALLKLETKEDCYRLLDDLLTIREISDLSQRLEVAKLLTEGVKYSDITLKTGASSATIGRVNRALIYGADGYNRILQKLKATDSTND